MNLAFADRDFYYGDPYALPAEPITGLLSKKYADQRRALINHEHNDTGIKPGDPYPFQGGKNPYVKLLKNWQANPPKAKAEGAEGFQQANLMSADEGFPCRHHLDPGRRCRRLGGFSDAQRWLDSGLHSRRHRHWPQPAHAELRAG